MDIRRLTLYAALGLIVYSLWSSWHHDYPLQVKTPINQSDVQLDNTLSAPLPGNDLPAMAAHSDNNTLPMAQSHENLRSLVAPLPVTTDVLALQIDLNQGDIISAKLLDYPVDVNTPNKPTALLYTNPEHRYVATSSLVVNNNGAKNLDLHFSAKELSYTLAKGQNSLQVVLQGKTEAGLNVEKVFTLTRGSYIVQVAYRLANEGFERWSGYLNTQLLQSSPKEDSSSIFHVGSYTGASYSNPGKTRYKKVSFKEMNKGNLNVDVQGGWIAMQQHYFLSAWVPDNKFSSTIYTRAHDNTFTIGSISKPLVVNPGKTAEATVKLYVGPEDTAVLKTIAPGLDLTVDYGWLWFVSSALFGLMKKIHSFVGNWGWSIVLVTVLIKLVFYRLSATSYKSMAGMRKLQPKLVALRERYGDDKAKISQATMELYRQEKVNPLGGCLPIIIQIPVFIALYWVLIESVELRQAPFIFWIKDLAAADPLHILPIIMGGTMLIQQRLNPAPPDPIQARVMMFLPLMFTALFWSFPAGLVLYWIVNNSLSILQQWYITRKYGDSSIPPKNHHKMIAANQ